ncbi:hypothetical protein N1F89_11390 [Aquibium sp. A9E412]|uniref:hypothetical protein n=1 Tax=Aquibium sp. A9E412 TaxID=2976767 RepID=UPI0025AFDECE|nr:hypothetical protein [Aquibium sp. A9E412]MDN2566829.1 hypothetical protein [Aquibium sp. A9E412]
MAGCQSGDRLGALDLGLGGQAEPPANEAAEGQVRQSELRAYCPPIALRSGTAYFNAYERNAEDDPEKVVYQAAISDVTRSCSYGADSITMTVAVAGRVVPGPVGKAGTITMPIRVAVLRGEEVVYSELHRYQVAVGDTSGATQFVFNDPNVVIPGPIDTSIRVFAGYDEGPYDTP